MYLKINIKSFISQKNLDMVGRKLYYIFSFYFYFSNTFYKLGLIFRKMLNIKVDNIYFPSNNIIYSFIRGVIIKNNIIKINNLYHNSKEINMIAVGDTDSKLSKYLNKINYDIMIHLGDLCYINDKNNLLCSIDTSKIILVPGCREAFNKYFNNKLWKSSDIDKYYPFFYNIKIMNCRDFKIKIITIHNYLFLLNNEYYDIIEFLKKCDMIKTDYCIILSHCPPYSISRHGPDYIIKSMIELSEIKFNLFLSGHEHCYMRFIVNKNNYIVNGCGGHSKYYFYDNDDNIVKKYNNEMAILHIKVTFKNIQIILKDVNEKIIDNHIIKKLNQI